MSTGVKETNVAHSDTMFEFATSAVERPRFFLMVCDSWSSVSFRRTIE